jgi:hypothetical protein
MVESNRDGLMEAEEKIRVLQERVLKLKLKKRSRYEELRKTMISTLCVGSLEVSR